MQSKVRFEQVLLLIQPQHLSSISISIDQHLRSLGQEAQQTHPEDAAPSFPQLQY